MTISLRVQRIARSAGFFLRDVDEGGVRQGEYGLLEIGPDATDEAILLLTRSGRAPVIKMRPKLPRKRPTSKD